MWAQSILGAQMPVHFILGGLAGQLLAADPAWATLPISVTVFGSMCAAPILSMLMGRFGRRTGFIIGALAGAAGAGLAAYGISEKSFTLLVCGAFLTGIYMSAHGFYRFAAADSASPEFRPKAISWVMAGGLVAALLGPELVKQFKDWMEPIPYAGGYKILVFVNLIGMIPLFFLDLPRPPRPAKGQRAGRPWREILSNRTVVVAMICAMISYALMNLVMTSTPLAMIACGFVTDDAAEVVRIHVVMMFLPSFFTGPLILRYGAQKSSPLAFWRSRSVPSWRSWGSASRISASRSGCWVLAGILGLSAQRPCWLGRICPRSVPGFRGSTIFWSSAS